jgi:uncharacterized protein YkwD
MIKKSILFLLLFLAAGATFFLFKNEILKVSKTSRDYAATDPAIMSFKRDVGAAVDQVFTADPLRAPLKANSGSLSVAGVLTNTNKERAKENLSALKSSTELTNAAKAKVADMFLKQYFEHKSPSGEGPADLARAANYDFIIVGENLALGNFSSDAELVTAWMNSPGHRENIMRASYSEIGIAVARGTFEGKTVWLAVQEFGAPKNSCPGVDKTLADSIDAGKEEISQREADLNKRKTEIDNSDPDSNPQYNAMVDEYNNRVKQFNSLVTLIKQKIEQYNLQAQRYNSCLQSFSKESVH